MMTKDNSKLNTWTKWLIQANQMSTYLLYQTFGEIFQERTNSLQWAKKDITLQLIFTLTQKAQNW